VNEEHDVVFHQHKTFLAGVRVNNIAAEQKIDIQACEINNVGVTASGQSAVTA